MHWLRTAGAHHASSHAERGSCGRLHGTFARTNRVAPGCLNRCTYRGLCHLNLLQLAGSQADLIVSLGCRRKRGGFDICCTPPLCCSAARHDVILQAVMSLQAPVPAKCGRGSYRAADGCKSCAAASSPFTKFHGGV